MCEAELREKLREERVINDYGLPDLREHEQIAADVSRCHPEAVLDGPVVPERYHNASPRIMWILREPNGTGPWDLREFLRNHSDSGLFGYQNWHSTYGALVKISHGLAKGLSALEVGGLQAHEVVDTIRDVAVINVNKKGGSSRVCWKKLRENAEEFSSSVERQILALKPDIIIAAGTADLLPHSYRTRLTPVDDKVIAAVELGHSWLVKCYHTAQRRLTHMELYGEILRALEKANWKQCRTQKM